jgi:hypothetical protein
MATGSASPLPPAQPCAQSRSQLLTCAQRGAGPPPRSPPNRAGNSSDACPDEPLSGAIGNSGLRSHRGAAHLLKITVDLGLA